MNVNLKQLFATILRWRTRGNQNERAERDIVALPLTYHELTVVIRFLGAISESERTDSDKHTVDLIRERIARFSERQGAWWDVDGVLVATVVKTLVAKPMS